MKNQKINSFYINKREAKKMVLREVKKMLVTEKYSKRMNILLTPKTHELLEQIAIQDGRKPGSLARHIIESWIEDKNKKSNEAI